MLRILFADKISLVLFAIARKIYRIPYSIDCEYGQKNAESKLKIELAQYSDKRHPDDEDRRRYYALKNSVRQRLDRKTQPPSQKIVFLHSFILPHGARRCQYFEKRIILISFCKTQYMRAYNRVCRRSNGCGVWR